MIWTLAFWRGAAERAVKTFAQALVGVIGVGAIGLLDVDWLGAISAAALATLVSVLTSIGNADFTAGIPVAKIADDGAYVVTTLAEVAPAEVVEWTADADPGSEVIEPDDTPLDLTHGESPAPERAAVED